MKKPSYEDYIKKAYRQSTCLYGLVLASKIQSLVHVENKIMLLL